MVQGRVKVTVPLDDGTQTVVDIFTTDDFFGESSLLGVTSIPSGRCALDNVTLMSWTSPEIEEQVERQPRLGIALLQMLVKRGLGLRGDGCKASRWTRRRSAWFVRCCGSPTGWAPGCEDGSIKIPPLTHQVISEYVGTSREIVTFQMNHFTPEGILAIFAERDPGLCRKRLREHLHIRRPGRTVSNGRRSG